MGESAQKGTKHKREVGGVSDGGSGGFAAAESGTASVRGGRQASSGPDSVQLGAAGRVKMTVPLSFVRSVGSAIVPCAHQGWDRPGAGEC